MIAALTATVVRAVESLRGQVVDLLFPPRCVGCQRMGAWLCGECQDQMPRMLPPVCTCCGDAVTAEGLCEKCRAEPLLIETIRSVFVFEGIVQEAIHRFKYGGLAVLSVPLAGQMARYWVEQRMRADVMVPVPLHTGRLRERGYNQAVLLAREMARQCGLPVDERVLARQRATAPQVELDARQRKENVRGAFCASSDALQGKDVVLIDDVCTTGATLEACAVALHSAGVHSVRALTLARAR